MTARQDGHRLHSFDALRAAMMLLGIVLHTSVSYTKTPLGQAWPFQDTSQNVGFDFIVFIIHLFRMPTFFVMAGFFAGLLYHREGVQGFLMHRVRRLLWPLMIGWVVLFPITQAAFTFALARGGAAGWSAATQQLFTAPFTGQLFSLMHLWFIYYLLLLCLIAPIVMTLVRKLPENARAAGMSFFGSVASRWWGILVLTLVTAVSLIPMQIVGLDTPLGFLPSPRILVAYGVFFTFGWLLYEKRELVATFASRPWLYLVAGLAVSLVYMTIVLPITPTMPAAELQAARMKGIPAAGLAIWLLIYGITGLFIKYMHLSRPVQRYLSDAAYWMYLIHLPFAIGFAGALAPLALPAIVKAAIVLSATTLVTVSTYYAFVRSTAIGHFLNGRRYARGLPETVDVAT